MKKQLLFLMLIFAVLPVLGQGTCNICNGTGECNGCGNGIDRENCTRCGGTGLCYSCRGSGGSGGGDLMDHFIGGFVKGLLGGSSSATSTPNQSAPLNGFHTKLYSDGTYKGNFKNGKMHGQGTLIMNNGNKYVGTFANGQISGKGTLTFANGDKYVGEFVNGDMHGKGTLTQKDGEKYVGEFKNNKMQGKGTYTSPFGMSYTGDFVNDLPDGTGTMVMKDEGLRYVGHFKNGKWDGEGTMYVLNAKKYIKGIFRNDELVQTIEEGTYTEPKKAAPSAKIPARKARRK